MEFYWKIDPEMFRVFKAESVLEEITNISQAVGDLISEQEISLIRI